MLALDHHDPFRRRVKPVLATPESYVIEREKNERGKKGGQERGGGGGSMQVNTYKSIPIPPLFFSLATLNGTNFLTI